MFDAYPKLPWFEFQTKVVLFWSQEVLNPVFPLETALEFNDKNEGNITHSLPTTRLLS